MIPESEVINEQRRSQISIVIPVFNEEEAIQPFLSRLWKVISGLEMPVEVLVVDDGSEDATVERALQASDEQVAKMRVICLTRNFGKEFALWIGLSQTRGDVVVTMDGDLQHPPEMIPPMVDLWNRSGFPVIHCVKRFAEGGWFRRLRSGAFYAIFRALTGQALRNQSDFKLLAREVVDRYTALPERRLFYRALISWMGYRSASLEFDVPDRKHGESRWSTRRLVASAIDAMLAFSARPLRLITWSAAAFLVFGIALAGMALYQKIHGVAASGFTTVIVVLVVASSSILFSIALVGAYVTRIYEEVKARPRAMIDSIRNPEPEKQEL